MKCHLKNKGLACLLAILLLGCNKGETESHQILKIGKEQKEKVPFGQIAKNIEFVPLNINWQNFPSHQDKAEIIKNILIISDRTMTQKIFAYCLISGNEILMPLTLGEGPDEIQEVSDFTTFNDTLYVLDGVRRNVFKLVIKENSSNFEIEEVVKLSFPATRIAKTADEFAFITGGDLMDLIYVTNNDLVVISKNLKKDITHLKKPINSFHKISNGDSSAVIFHSLFDYSLHQINEGKIGLFKKIEIDGFSQTSIPDKDYKLDLEGFNMFYESQKKLPSHFSIFEANLDTFILMYFEQDIPKLAFGNSDQVFNIRMDRVDNNVSFEKLIPKIIGVSDDYYLAIIAKEEIDKTHPEFEKSVFAEIIRNNPNVEFFALKFQI